MVETPPASLINAIGQRDKVAGPSGTDRFDFNTNGRRFTTWQDGNASAKLDQYYSDQGPVAYFSVDNSMLNFEYGDQVGSERMSTDANGKVQSAYVSLPFGEPNATSGADLDPGHFAGLDEDGSFSSTSLGLHHAMFREYSSIQGRWMSPDPYSGSYQLGNPQSFNRYSYLLNAPLNGNDVLGLDGDVCEWVPLVHR